MNENHFCDDSNKKYQKIKQGGLVYLLNTDNNTACVVSYDFNYEKIYIPRSIVYELHEYIITGINEASFMNSKIKTVQFAKDSELCVIGEKSFAYSPITNIIIPSHVTRICEEAFCFCQNLEKVEFLSDSSLQTIENDAFNSCESLKSLTIPSSVLELKRGWCNGATNLNEVTIIPNTQQNISYIENKIIVGKTDIESDEFDILIFAPRNIKKATIPPTIKIIGAFSFSSTVIKNIFIPSNVIQICEGAFSSCSKLKCVEFEKNSNLQIIEEFAFAFSSLSNIVIPSHLTTIGKASFSWTRIKTVELESESELQTIEESAFDWSPIESLTIPSNILELKKGWCRGTKNLQNVNIISKEQQNIKYMNDASIIGKTDIMSNDFNILIFVPRNTKTITIEPCIKIIGPYSFSGSLIEQIDFPSHVTKICENSFYKCKKLKSIDFSKDSELKIIEQNAFDESEIESLTIPSKVTELKDGWCHITKKLTKIKISPKNQKFILFDKKLIIGKSNNRNNEYDKLIFACRDVRNVLIPSFIKIIGHSSFAESKLKKICIPPQTTQICESAFKNCSYLQKVEVPMNSDLCELGKNAFFNNSFYRIFISSKIQKIGESTFKYCSKLEYVDFPQNSQLKTIEDEAFYETPIRSFHLPPSVTKISVSAFELCANLQIFEIEDESHLKKLDINGFRYFLQNIIFYISSKLSDILQ